MVELGDRNGLRSRIRTANSRPGESCARGTSASQPDESRAAIRGEGVKLPASSKLSRWDGIRARDRAALRAMRDEPFTVPAFCAALAKAFDHEEGIAFANAERESAWRSGGLWSVAGEDPVSDSLLHSA